MKILTVSLIWLALFAPVRAYCQPVNECPEKSLGVKTVTGILTGASIEEDNFDIPSWIYLTVNGEEVSVLGDPDELKKYFKNKEGKKFKVS